MGKEYVKDTCIIESFDVHTFRQLINIHVKTHQVLQLAYSTYRVLVETCDGTSVEVTMYSALIIYEKEE